MTTITIDKELALRVLEAMLEAQRFADTVGAHEGTWFGHEETMDEALKTIPHLRAAIEAHPQEPVGFIYDFDGYGWRFLDSGSGSGWKELFQHYKDAQWVYTTPQLTKEQK